MKTSYINQTRFIGIDFGKTWTVGACLIDLDDPNTRVNLSIKKTTLLQPLFLYQKWLRKKKEGYNIFEIENDNTVDPFIKYNLLSNFYNSLMVKRRFWDYKKA